MAHGNDDNWTLQDLREHLQWAVGLEYWTVPFYMASMYSIKDPTTDAYRLMQSVVYQEMLHVQLAANVANAFGATIDDTSVFHPIAYDGTIPHLQFTRGEEGRDPVDPTQTYEGWSAKIGPLDDPRINAMCLIEYPEDEASEPPKLNQTISDYSTIGEFYQAVLFGANQYVDAIVPNHNQVDIFKNFYRDLPSQTVTSAGVYGLEQVVDLIHVITDQGEGVRRTDVIPVEYRNTADGFNTEQDHFSKFNDIKNLMVRPDTYSGDADPPKGSAALEAQNTLLRHFDRFRGDMVSLFTGGDMSEIWPHMAILGGDILNCWKSNALPKFSGAVN